MSAPVRLPIGSAAGLTGALAAGGGVVGRASEVSIELPPRFAAITASAPANPAVDPIGNLTGAPAADNGAVPLAR